MAKAYKTCKVCGKEYEYCKTKADGFRWMDVACCPEHATEYFKKIAISRGEIETPKTSSKKKNKPIAVDPVEDVIATEPSDGFMAIPEEITEE